MQMQLQLFRFRCTSRDPVISLRVAPGRIGILPCSALDWVCVCVCVDIGRGEGVPNTAHAER